MCTASSHSERMPHQVQTTLRESKHATKFWITFRCISQSITIISFSKSTFTVLIISKFRKRFMHFSGLNRGTQKAMSNSWLLVPMTMTLFKKLKISRWDHPGLYYYKRVGELRRRENSGLGGQGQHTKAEAEVGVMYPQRQGASRAANHHQKNEESWTDSPSEPQEGTNPVNNLMAGFWAPELWDRNLHFFKAMKLIIICYNR